MNDQIYMAYPGGKHKALTMSYDDGRIHDRRLVETFNRHGIKGTFHLNSGTLGKPGYVAAEELPALYRGHEVSAHTVTHPEIARCPMPMAVQQVLDDRRALEGIIGLPVRGLSYPFGSHSAAIRAMLPHVGICYSRVVGDTFDFHLPEDFLQWTSTCHHDNRLMEMAERFLAMGVQFVPTPRLMYVWGHSYEFNDKDNWALIEDFCQRMGGQDDIWYATNLEIYDYCQAYDRLQFAADHSFVVNPSAVSVWIWAGEWGNMTLHEIPAGALVRL
ncbi:MAG: polysaccharide deacetylase family protein [Oscillospiraceae bacterium]|jgi:peptidoglycan/xylan/chitin deacetylase (PgdA/CDA1 family)|nr:polysaccharide deacetylase family protein [Oscillospiraceae bacterium]